MDTVKTTEQFRLNKWAAIIKDRNSSGLTIDGYCKQHGLSRNCYYYYLRKLKNQILEKGDFVEIKPPAAAVEETQSLPIVNNDFRTELVIRTSSCDICINQSTSMSLVSKVMEVLKDA